MATIQNPQQQNEDLANPGNPVNQPNPTAGTSGGVGTPQGGVGGAAGPNQTPVSPVASNSNGANSSGYTDVGTYLNANQNNQASNNLGGQVAGNLTNAYNSTMGDINNSVSAQTSAINSGYTPENTQLIQQAEANPTGFAYEPTPAPAAPQQAAGAINPILNSSDFSALSPLPSTAPSNPQLNQANITAFQNQLNDTYTGPTSWNDVTNANGTTTPGYGTLQGEVNTAQQNANINTPGMANVLTQQVEQQLNPGQTSQGINNLDTLLLTGNQNNVNQVQAAAQPFAGLNTYLNNQNTTLGTDVTNAQANAAQASQDALNAFTGGNGTLTNLNNTITGTANQDLTQAQQQQAQLLQDINNLYGGVAQNNAPVNIGTYGGGTTQVGNDQNYTVGNLNPQDLASLGINANQWTALQQAMQNAGTSQYETGHNFGAPSATQQINLDQFLNQQTPSATNINPGTVATPQQYQEVAAINQLLGSQAPVQSEVINPLNAAEAGTYNPSNLDQFNYQGALSNAQNTATQEIAQAQAEAQGLTSSADLAHAQSQHSGGFLNGLEQDITHPLSTLGAAINPAAWIGNASNLIKGQQVSPTAINPTGTSTQSAAPAALAAYLLKASPFGAAAGAGAGGAGAATTGEAIAGAAASHGGEVKDDGTINSFLDKQKKV